MGDLRDGGIIFVLIAFSLSDLHSGNDLTVGEASM